MLRNAILSLLAALSLLSVMRAEYVPETCTADIRDAPWLGDIEPRTITTEPIGNYILKDGKAANVKQLDGVTIMKDVIYLLTQVSTGKDTEKSVTGFINLDKNTRRAQYDHPTITGKEIRSCEYKGPEQTVYNLFIMGADKTTPKENTIFKVVGNLFYQKESTNKSMDWKPFIKLPDVHLRSWSLTPDCRVTVVTTNDQLITYSATGAQEGSPLQLPAGTQYAQATSGGYLVSNVNEGKSRILLLDAAGEEWHRYGPRGAYVIGKQPLDTPTKILTDRYGRLIVLDSKHNRVVMIECDLSCGRILVPKLPATILDIAYAAEKLVVITNEKDAKGFPTGLKEYSITVPAVP